MTDEQATQCAIIEGLMGVRIFADDRDHNAIDAAAAEITRLRAAYKAAAEHGNNCYADTLRLAHCDVGFCQCGKAPEMTKQAACATPGTLRHLLDQEARGILAQTTTQDETTKPRVQDIAVTIAEQAAEITRLRAALEPFADVYDWMICNGHDPSDIDFLVRGPQGQIMGHLQVQSPTFMRAWEVLNCK